MRNDRAGFWRVTGVLTALATAAAIASAAPAQAQTTAQLSAYVSDGWGCGTITSQPAGINCHTGSYVNDGPSPNPVTISTGYNYTWVMFCPSGGLCSAG
ncbi:hypothetical protein [Streptomyces iakyrus]|uniref:hypothetical protein n=1 Tax=Streptomyces iakyrus TaxID=68219 RepID=UPI0036A32EB6